MKNITASVTNQAWRETPVWAAAYEASPSHAVQLLIPPPPGLKPAPRKLPLLDTGAKLPDFTFTAENSAHKPAFRSQSSAPDPAF